MTQSCCSNMSPSFAYEENSNLNQKHVSCITFLLFFVTCVTWQLLHIARRIVTFQGDPLFGRKLFYELPFLNFCLSGPTSSNTLNTINNSMVMICSFSCLFLFSKFVILSGPV